MPRWLEITVIADRCHSCGQKDPPPPWHYACRECGHAWKTVADLVRHDFKVAVALDPAAEIRTVDEIHTCPCCAHDL